MSDPDTTSLGDEMAAVVTANDIARDLRVDPTAFRRWLRILVGEGNPIVGGHQAWDRWVFPADQADELRHLFESRRRREYRPVRSGTQLSVRFQGSEVRDATVRELVDFLGALDSLYQESWSMQLGREAGYELTLRHVSAGSPFVLIVLIPLAAKAVGTAAVATTSVIVAINVALQGRKVRARTQAETDAIRAVGDAEADAIRLKSQAEADAIRAKAAGAVRESDARTRAIEALYRPADANSRNSGETAERAGLLAIDDTTGLLPDFSGPDVGDFLDSERVRRAAEVILDSPIELESVAVRYARPRQRRSRRNRRR
jgi:hypothetical protein